MIRILTDSSAGFTLEEAAARNFEMAYMPITFDDAEYLDAFNISSEDFYKKLTASKTLPKTSMISETIFTEFFEDAKKKGDEMIVLPISSGLSATYEAAVKAQKAVGYNGIYVIDTLNTISGLVALVMHAVHLREKKMKAKDIAEEIERLVPKTIQLAAFDTLKYLRAGGRISASAAVVGGMIGVKPIILVKDGKLENVHKCIGAKKAQAYILSKLKEYDFDSSFPVYFNHASAKEECNAVAEQAKKEYGIIHGGNYNISATVGTHTGPGAISIAFFKK